MTSRKSIPVLGDSDSLGHGEPATEQRSSLPCLSPQSWSSGRPLMDGTSMRKQPGGPWL